MFNRVLKYALKNILRNKFLSFSSIIVLMLLMFFINILLVLHNVSFKLIDSINSKLSISLYLKDTYDRNSSEVVKLVQNIEDISKGINTEYKSREQLLDELREKDPKLVGILENENPLPNTIVVSKIGMDDYALLNERIQNMIHILDNGSKLENKENFTDYNGQYSRIIKVISVLNILSIGLYVVISIFLLSISIIVYSIIGNFIYYYRDEIYITKLVGGNNFFIHGPFIFQGMIYTFLSFLGSGTIFMLLLNNLSYVLSSDHSFDFILNNFDIILFGEFIIFTLIGALSGYFSSRKYINNQ
ncbi:hypothetical protein EOM39_00565 [Candidatus Gracilibacteria bacterium]|nr:hypothetical protein [Candidatus Gracilibacteria bacterium]